MSIKQEQGVSMARGSAALWTIEDDVRLANLKRGGLANAVIATKLGRSLNAVNHRLSKMDRRVAIFGEEPLNLTAFELAALNAE